MKERISYTEIGQVPKVEELYLSLQISISNTMANWKKREDFQSFWITCLDGETKKLIMEQNWDVLGNILALLIYGLVFSQPSKASQSQLLYVSFGMFRRRKKVWFLHSQMISFTLYIFTMRRGVAVCYVVFHCFKLGLPHMCSIPMPILVR